VGNTLIEAPFAWRCRRHEVRLAYGGILDELMRDGPLKHPARICRAPAIVGQDTIYDGRGVSESSSLAVDQPGSHAEWAINDSRPAFDTADFMRFGRTILGQLSHVTNEKGVAYLRALLPPGHTLELVQVTDPHAMHIDATILPLRRGLLVYNPERVTEAALRRHAVLRDWELHAYPFVPKARTEGPPSYMCSPWLVLNALSLDEKRIVVEQGDVEFADWLRTRFGMEPIPVPFRHVHSLGGSFHCATVDLVRGGGWEGE
jgi:glycine amidinotransferase